MTAPDDGPQRALVTGASGGFGRAIAERLQQDGALVAVNGRDPRRLAATASALRAKGGTVLELPGDASDHEFMKAAVARICEVWDRLDLLVDNAGVAGPTGPSWELCPTQWWAALEDNLRTSVAGAFAAVPAMLAAGGGRVVHISSEAGHGTWPFVSSYSTAKAGGIKFFENLAIELRNEPVLVFILHPGIMETGLTTSALAGGRDPAPWNRRWAMWFRQQIRSGNTIAVNDATEAVLTLAAGGADHLQGSFITTADVRACRHND